MSDNSKLQSPNSPAWCPGQPSIQAAAEAQDRCRARREYAESHPGEYSMGDYEQRQKDYADIERVDSLPGWGGGLTIEPGDALVSRRGK